MSEQQASSRGVEGGDQPKESAKKTTDLASKYAQWDQIAREVEKEEETEESGMDSLFKVA